MKNKLYFVGLAFASLTMSGCFSPKTVTGDLVVVDGQTLPFNGQNLGSGPTSITVSSSEISISQGGMIDAINIPKGSATGTGIGDFRFDGRNDGGVSVRTTDTTSTADDGSHTVSHACHQDFVERRVDGGCRNGGFADVRFQRFGTETDVFEAATITDTFTVTFSDATTGAVLATLTDVEPRTRNEPLRRGFCDVGLSIPVEVTRICVERPVIIDPIRRPDPLPGRPIGVGQPPIRRPDPSPPRRMDPRPPVGRPVGPAPIRRK